MGARRRRPASTSRRSSRCARWRLRVRRRGREPRPGARGVRRAVRARRPKTRSPAPAACSASSSRCACAARRDIGGERIDDRRRSASAAAPGAARTGRGSAARARVSAWFGDEALSVAAIAAAGERGPRPRGDQRDDLRARRRRAACASATRGSRRPSTREGRQRRAALELWITDDGPPRRATGEVVCGTTLDLGRLRLDTAFLSWRMDDRTGVGRYDILRRNDDAA